MPCYKPLSGYRSRLGGLTFKKSESMGQPMDVPCGQCLGCRLMKAQEWATRCMHEVQTSPHPSSFITLTYAPEHLPPHGSLRKSDFQKFMKSLRKSVAPKKIRYYHCGEYGEDLQRPHYHACIFNHDFPDKTIHRLTSKGHQQYTSVALARLWPHGYHEIGSFTYNSAAYAARYCIKKLNGDRAEQHYKSLPDQHGEIFDLDPEYVTMSLRPGIGQAWYKKYYSDIFPDDHVVYDGKTIKTPTYYRELHKREHPNESETLRKKRVKLAKKHAKDNTPDRLATREIVKKAQIQRLIRNYEEKQHDPTDFHHP